MKRRSKRGVEEGVVVVAGVGGTGSIGTGGPGARKEVGGGTGG